jgi:hypothetical protein
MLPLHAYCCCLLRTTETIADRHPVRRRPPLARHRRPSGASPTCRRGRQEGEAKGLYRIFALASTLTSGSPLPSTPPSAILSVGIYATGRGGKRHGLAACVGLYHRRGGRTPTGRATVKRLHPHDDRHKCITMNICQGCGGWLPFGSSRFRAVGTNPSRFDLLT